MPLDQVDVDNIDNDTGTMGFLDHLEELRWHLIRATVSIFFFATLVFLAKDFVFQTIIFGPKNPEFITYKAICQFSNAVGLGDQLCFYPPDFNFVTPIFGELFISHIKVSIFLGIIISFPYIFWEIWRFIKPGLYPKEKKAARGMVFICSMLFLSGILFGYYVIAPFAVTFLAGYEIEGVKATPSLASFINYLTMFTLPVGIVFELPIFVFFFSKVGLITADFMKKYRRHAFILFLIVAAIITPPDLVTQFLIGAPLYFLYEISIFIARRVEKKQAAQEKREMEELKKRVVKK